MAGGMQGGYQVPGGMPPPVPVRRSGSNFWIWALVGCGGLVVIGIILVAVMAVQIGNKSGLGKFVESASTAQVCAQKAEAIHEALEAYRNAHKGEYPKSLSALVPTYLSNQADLSCGETGNGTESMAEYTPPAPDAPSDAIVVSFFKGDFDLNFGPQKQNTKMYVRLLHDGRVVMDQVQRVDLPASRLRRTSGSN